MAYGDAVAPTLEGGEIRNSFEILEFTDKDLAVAVPNLVDILNGEVRPIYSFSIERPILDMVKIVANYINEDGTLKPEPTDSIRGNEPFKLKKQSNSSLAEGRYPRVVYRTFGLIESLVEPKFNLLLEQKEAIDKGWLCRIGQTNLVRSRIQVPTWNASLK